MKRDESLLFRVDRILRKECSTKELTIIAPTLLSRIGAVWSPLSNPNVYCIVSPFNRGPSIFGRLHLSVREEDSRFRQLEGIAYWWSKHVARQTGLPEAMIAPSSYVMRVLLVSTILQFVHKDCRVVATYLGSTTDFSRLPSASEHDVMLTYAIAVLSESFKPFLGPLPWQLPSVGDLLIGRDLGEEERGRQALTVAQQMPMFTQLVLNVEGAGDVLS